MVRTMDADIKQETANGIVMRFISRQIPIRAVLPIETVSLKCGLMEF